MTDLTVPGFDLDAIQLDSGNHSEREAGVPAKPTPIPINAYPSATFQ